MRDKVSQFLAEGEQKGVIMESTVFLQTPCIFGTKDTQELKWVILMQS